jgi:hypothetical protein
VWRGTWDATDVEGCWVDWLEYNVDVECGHGNLGVNVRYGFCEIGFGGFGGEGAGWVVDSPERHGEVVFRFNGKELKVWFLCCWNSSLILYLCKLLLVEC